jgi:hypothetical protein
MRKSHIDYMRTMTESVIIDGIHLFAPEPDTKKQGKFLEMLPAADTFQKLLPVCVIYSAKINDNLDGRQTTDTRVKTTEKIAPILDTNGNKILRSIRTEFKQEFNYTLHFILKNPTRDILSDIDSPGILDQCKRYIVTNPKTYSKVLLPANSVTTDNLNYPVNVDVSGSELITQYAGDGLYILGLDVVFRDKLITLIEEPTIYGTLEVEQPIGVVTI